MSRRRMRAIIVKELREYRHSSAIIGAMVLLPIVFLVQPLIGVFATPAAAALKLAHQHTLLYLLALPALVPATLAAHAVVGERQQDTLEPVLTTPIRREEFLLAKALAAFIPSVVIAYAVYAIFLVAVGVFARPAVSSAMLRGSDIAAQVVFTPLIAAWSIWVAIMISARSNDVRVAQQLSVLASLATVAVTSLIAYDVIRPTLGLAVGLFGVLAVLDGLGWRITSAVFDRERLITR